MLGRVFSAALERFAAGVGLAILSTLLFLLAAEGLLRLYDGAVHDAPAVSTDPRAALYQDHPYLPTVLKPSTDYRDSDTAGHVNALGLRGPERTVEKAPGTLRVLCVGGSTTFGAGIVGDENTWPARLEEQLSRLRPDRRFEVWNAGVPGYTTAENVIYLSLRLIDFHPDVVVLYEGYNDFKPNRHPGFRGDYAHWRNRAVVPQRPLLDNLRLYTKLRSLIRRLRPKGDAEVTDPGTGLKLQRFDSVDEEGIGIFKRNLETMIAVTRSAGALPVLATYAHPCTEANLQARPGQFDYLREFLPGLTFSGVMQAFDRHNEAIREVSRAREVILADAALNLPPDPDLFVDHVHFNARGAGLFAAVVAPAVISAARTSDAAP